MNIVDMLKDQVTGQIAGKLGGAFGESEEATKGAMGGMLGSILGGLLGKASTPQGAEDLSRELDNHDGGLLDSIGGMFGGGQQEEVAKQGGGILGSLLGDKLGGVGSILAKVSGMKSGSMIGMLGMLAPIVMGFLGKMKKSQGLDAGGLSSMLMSQKDNIASAMPEGMAGALGLPAGLLGDVSAPAPAPAPAAAAPATSAAPATAPFNPMKVIAPLLLVGALAFLGYKLMNRGVEEEPDKAKGKSQAPTKIIPLPGAQLSGDIDHGFDVPEIEGAGDLPNQMAGLFGRLETQLGGITSEDDARAAMSSLEPLGEQMEGFATQFKSLPETAQSGISGFIKSTLMSRLTGVLDKAKGIPGVSQVLQPFIEKMMTSMKVFTG